MHEKDAGRMDENRREGLSRLLSLMLRHKPERFELILDDQGYADLSELVDATRQKYSDVTEDEILEIVEGAEKRRFERTDHRVRARYGHSFPIDLGLEPVIPPDYLYYAAMPVQIRAITGEGLRPGDRQHVHLSITSEAAVEVAKNRTETPVLFRIHAREAAESGIEFYDRTPVFLTRAIPPTFIEMVQDGSHTSLALYGRRKKRTSPRTR
jgi:putative RNA 2'-phosphotransferase